MSPRYIWGHAEKRIKAVLRDVICFARHLKMQQTIVLLHCALY